MIRRLFPAIVVAAAAVLLPGVWAYAQDPASLASQPTATRAWPPAGVERIGPGVTAPRLVKDQKPAYPSAARDAGIGGVVEVEAVVLADGKVGDVRVTRSLDKQYGLDDSAVDAVKGWEFAPGRKDGKAVPVLVSIELTFTVRK